MRRSNCKSSAALRPAAMACWSWARSARAISMRSRRPAPIKMWTLSASADHTSSQAIDVVGQQILFGVDDPRLQLVTDVRQRREAVHPGVALDGVQRAQQIRPTGRAPAEDQADQALELAEGIFEVGSIDAGVLEHHQVFLLLRLAPLALELIGDVGDHDQDLVGTRRVADGAVFNVVPAPGRDAGQRRRQLTERDLGRQDPVAQLVPTELQPGSGVGIDRLHDLPQSALGRGVREPGVEDRGAIAREAAVEIDGEQRLVDVVEHGAQLARAFDDALLETLVADRQRARGLLQALKAVADQAQQPDAQRVEHDAILSRLALRRGVAGVVDPGHLVLVPMIG